MAMGMNANSACLCPELTALLQADHHAGHLRYALGSPHLQFWNPIQVNYGVKFQMMSKIDVNGPNTHPVYQVRGAPISQRQLLHPGGSRCCSSRCSNAALLLLLVL